MSDAFFAAFLRDLCDKAVDRKVRKELPQRTQISPKIQTEAHLRAWAVG
jgi:hypothetical protein